MPQLISAIFALLLLTSCVTADKFTQADLTGIFIIEGSAIKLHPDGTFLYRWANCLERGETKGNWQIKKKRLILHSERQPTPPKYPPLAVLEKSAIPQDSITLKIVLPGMEPVKGAYILLREQETDSIFFAKKVDENGMVNIPKIYSIDIGIHGVMGQSYTFTSAQEPYTDYTIQVSLPEPYYRYFTHEKWKYRKGKLHPEMWYGWRKYRKKKFFKRLEEED